MDMKKPLKTISEVPSIMKEWDLDKNNAEGLNPEVLGAQSNRYAYWKCKYGHSWKAKINNRYNGRGCPICAKKQRTSFPEQAVFFYLKKKFPDAINSYKTIFDNGMELDIFIPSVNIGIEYDGSAWHKTESLEKERIKYHICKEHGIYLIRLKENRDHYRGDLGVADSIILVRKAFLGDNKSYHYLDYAIRELLHYLFDYDITELFSVHKTIERAFLEAVDGPVVLTDVNTKRDKNLIFENYLVTLEQNSLGHVYPEITEIWHPTKNGELTPYMFSPHSKTVVWWKGKCGHEWDNPIDVVSRGQRCPYCTGQRVLKGFNDLATIKPEIAKQWHPTLNGVKTPDMYTFGSGHKAYWLCKVCGQTWKSAINIRTRRLGNSGCPYCAHEKPIKGINDLVTLRPDLMEEWDYDKNIGIDPYSLMPNSNKRVFWKCTKCGYEYKAFISNRNKGNGCKRCAGQVLIKGINDLETLYPDIAKQWDYSQNELKPCDVFPASNKKYSWVCSLGHTWRATPNSRIYGRGCPFCSGNKVLVGFNDLQTTHPEIAKLWHPTKNGHLLPTQVFKGHRDKVWLICPVCKKDYDTRIPNVIKGFGKCPYCSKHKGRGQCVELIETGQRFSTLKEAATAIGKSDFKNIHSCCVGKTKTAYGYHWRYVIKEK